MTDKSTPIRFGKDVPEPRVGRGVNGISPETQEALNSLHAVYAPTAVPQTVRLQLTWDDVIDIYFKFLVVSVAFSVLIGLIVGVLYAVTVGIN